MIFTFLELFPFSCSLSLRTVNIILNERGRILTIEIADLPEGTTEDTGEVEVEETADDTTELDLLKKEDITATILVERVISSCDNKLSLYLHTIRIHISDHAKPIPPRML